MLVCISGATTIDSGACADPFCALGSVRRTSRSPDFLLDMARLVWTYLLPFRGLSSF